jgi:hypothetical protein
MPPALNQVHKILQAHFLLVSETTPSSLSSADESSSGIRDSNCDLNGLNTAKVIRDTNSNPRNSEIYIKIVVLAKFSTIIMRKNNNSTVGPNNSRLTHIFYHHGKKWLGHKISFCHETGNGIISSALDYVQE